MRVNGALLVLAAAAVGGATQHPNLLKVGPSQPRVATAEPTQNLQSGARVASLPGAVTLANAATSPARPIPVPSASPAPSPVPQAAPAPIVAAPAPGQPAAAVIAPTPASAEFAAAFPGFANFNEPASSNSRLIAGTTAPEVVMGGQPTRAQAPGQAPQPQTASAPMGMLPIIPLLPIPIRAIGSDSFDLSPVTRPARLPRAVDLLWVIDNSGTMKDKQDSLAAGLQAFAEKNLGSDRDIRLGVITTDAYLATEAATQTLTTLVPATSAPTDWLQQLTTAFAAKLKAGTDGSGSPRAMESIVKFLRDQNQLHLCRTAPAGLPGADPECFFRKSAARGLVVVSDTNDGSIFKNTPAGPSVDAKVVTYNTKYTKQMLDSYFKSIDALANGQDSSDPNYFVSTIVRPETTAQPKTGCDPTAAGVCESSLTYATLVNLVAGDATNSAAKASSVQNVESTEYSKIYDALGKSLEQATPPEALTSVFLLRTAPDPFSVTIDVVLLDGAIHSIAQNDFVVNGQEVQVRKSALGDPAKIARIVIHYLF